MNGVTEKYLCEMVGNRRGDDGHGLASVELVANISHRQHVAARYQFQMRSVAPSRDVVLGGFSVSWHQIYIINSISSKSNDPITKFTL